MIARCGVPYLAAMRLSDWPASTTICRATGASFGVSGLGAAASGATPFETVAVGASQAATNPIAARAAAASNRRFCTGVLPFPLIAALGTSPRHSIGSRVARPGSGQIRHNIYAGVAAVSQHLDAFPFAAAGVRRHGERIAGRSRGNRPRRSASTIAPGRQGARGSTGTEHHGCAEHMAVRRLNEHGETLVVL